MTKIAVAVLLALIALGGFSTAASASLSASANGVARMDAEGTVWLCRPGLKDDPCAGNLSTTVVTASNKRTVKHSVVTGKAASSTASTFIPPPARSKP